MALDWTSHADTGKHCATGSLGSYTIFNPSDSLDNEAVFLVSHRASKRRAWTTFGQYDTLEQAKWEVETYDGYRAARRA